MSNYKNLQIVLDQIRKEAPLTYKKYHEPSGEKADQARAKALIHLFLKAKFGLLAFEEREKYVTDDSDDGGIDGYYIDREQKKIYFIQSKYRTNEENFENKEISLDELLKMDIDEITKGKIKNEQNVKYNSKIQAFIKELQSIGGLSRYEYIIVILANLKKITDTRLKRIVGDFAIERFGFVRTYNELVFPIASGNYYNVSDLYIELDLLNKYGGSKINYKVKLKQFECDISVVFVPTLEIGRTMYKYKNTILKYNPRSYLDLKNNKVNQAIQSTITQTTTNEFALFNNGITILSDETKFNENVGKENLGQLFIKNPQIINGGQTAYTLSNIYKEHKDDASKLEAIFKEKEVMVKIITFPNNQKIKNIHREKLIEDISKATNQQSPIIEADRRSNDQIQLEIQSKIFEKYGYYYERKNGEFFDGLQNEYLTKDKIIDREILLRVALSLQGNASKARSQGAKELFSLPLFAQILVPPINVEKLFWGFACLAYLNQKQKRQSKKDKFGTSLYGNAMRYGKYAMVYVVVSKDFKPKLDLPDLQTAVVKFTDETLKKWKSFESDIVSKKTNHDYFKEVDGKLELNYDGYYKGKTINSDLQSFFKI